MSSIRRDELSPFGLQALKLDEDFSELGRLCAKIERLDLESESDLDHAVKLMGEFARQGQTIAEDMQHFSKSLQEARERSEVAARSVEQRAQQVLERQGRRDRLKDRLIQLDQEIKSANEGLLGGRKSANEALSDAEKERIKAQFEQLQRRLADFIDPAQKIRDEAAQLKFRRIERDAQSMLDTLVALRRKLETILSGK